MIIAAQNLMRYFRKSLKEPHYAFEVLIKKTRSLVSYYLFNGYSAYPETISLFLTYNCNLRCTMCGYWGRCGATKSKTTDLLTQYLSLAELQGFIESVSFFKPNITLFGGEPLLYRDWPALVRCIKKAGLRCNMVTNGTLLKDRAEEVINSGIDEIIFSLEGPRDIHDRITQVNGAFDSALSGLGAIRKEKDKKNIKKPFINVACTISEENYKFLEEIVAIAASIKAASITFHYLCFINREILERNNEIIQRYFWLERSDWEGFMREKLPEIEVENLVDSIKAILTSRHRISVFFYPNFNLAEVRQYYSNFEFTSRNYTKRCLSPWTTVYIFPDGSVGPCEELNLYFGNIKGESFKNIWNNVRYRHFRAVLKKEKLFPVCSHCSEMYRF